MKQLSAIAKELQQKLSNRVKFLYDIKASAVTTFGIGSNIPVIIDVSDANSLIDIIGICQAAGYEYRILGAGSNIVMPDQSLNCLVVKLGEGFRRVAFSQPSSSFLEELKQEPVYRLNEIGQLPHNLDSTTITAYGGVSLMQLCSYCCRLGLSGLEWAAGIPGSVGGAVRMNAGAHGKDISSAVEEVVILNNESSLVSLKATDLGFSYRSSIINSKQCVIAARFKLSPSDPLALIKERKRLLDIRRKTQPINLPSAGSVFRNPNSATIATCGSDSLPPAGKLLDQAGLKGYRTGGVEYSMIHANWIVKALPSAQAHDVITLMKLGQQRVSEMFGIYLKPEIIFW